jgi:hypothetical protein
MNLKCKVTLNINIVNFLIIHVTIDDSYLKLWMSYKKKMEICLSCIENEKCEFKKNHSSVKKKIKIGHHQLMKNLKIKFIETFPI